MILFLFSFVPALTRLCLPWPGLVAIVPALAPLLSLLIVQLAMKHFFFLHLSVPPFSFVCLSSLICLSLLCDLSVPFLGFVRSSSWFCPFLLFAMNVPLLWNVRSISCICLLPLSSLLPPVVGIMSLKPSAESAKRYNLASSLRHFLINGVIHLLLFPSFATLRR